MTDLFVAPDTVTPVDGKDYHAELVGEGKRYANDQIAARALIEKDAFIEQLKLETAGMREELKRADALEDIKQLLVTQARPPNTEANQRREESPEQTSIKMEDIDKRLEQRMAERELTTKRERNLSFVQSKLLETLGENFSQTIKQRAAKLGLGTKFLNDLAAEQPEAFFKLMEVAPQSTRQSITPPVSSQFTIPPQANGERTAKYYNELRQKMGNGKYFADHRLQNQILEDAKRLGDAFNA